MAVKACELRDKHAKLIDEQSELAARVEKEKRPFTADEKKRSDEIFVEAKSLAETISSIERFEANKKMTEEDVQRAGRSAPARDRGAHRQASSIRSAGRSGLTAGQEAPGRARRGDFARDLQSDRQEAPGLLHADEHADEVGHAPQLPRRRPAAPERLWPERRASYRRHHGRRRRRADPVGHDLDRIPPGARWSSTSSAGASSRRCMATSRCPARAASAR